MDGAAGSWGWDEATVRAFGARVVDMAVGQFREAATGPAVTPPPPEVLGGWATGDWPERGLGPDRLLDELARAVTPYPFGNGSPRFHAWVNSAPDRAGALVDALAAAMNPSCAGGGHAAVHCERQVLRWLTGMVGMPAGAGGLLVSGASQGTVVALAAARHRHAGVDVRELGLAGMPPLVVYAGAEAHSCVTKAVELLGIGRRWLRTVPADDAGRLRPDALAAAVAADRAAGLRPVAVVATAGSVNTGSIDPLDAVADVCGREDVWLHVDGAYGAPAVLTEEYSAELAPLGRADSVCVDPHKWMYVPVDSSAVLVREPAALRDAFSLVPPYLRDGDEPWFSEFGTEQTRPFRALRTWVTLAATGRDGYRRLIAHDLELARYLCRRVDDTPELELLAAGLSVVLFRCRAPGGGADALTRAVVAAVQRAGRSYVAGTRWRERAAVRACFVNPLTCPEHVDALLDEVLAARTSALA